MKRIMLIGSGGSGKSTLAKKLGKLLSLEVYHLDRLFWKPGWVSRDRKEWLEIIDEMIHRQSWIIDGNYGSTIHTRLQEADTVIYLDFPRWLCLYRVIKRRFQYRNKPREDMTSGCDEKLDWKFVKFVWDFPVKERPVVMKMLEANSAGKEIIILHSPKEVRQFLRSLHSNQKSSQALITE